MKKEQKQSKSLAAMPDVVEARRVETEAPAYLQIKTGLKSGACYPRTVCGPYGCRTQTVCASGGGGCYPRTVCGPYGCRTQTIC
jgi:hypothetical protein